MNTLKTLIASGFTNWKTTLIGAFIALLTAYNTGVFDGQTGQELWFSIAIFLWGFVARDANKSSQDSGIRKPTFTDELLNAAAKRKRHDSTPLFKLWWLAPFLCLTSCASTTFYDRASGKKLANFDGDMEGVHFVASESGAFEWSAAKVDHSTATKAQGEAAAGKINALGAAAATAVFMR
jgi:hypothetical protein